MYRLVLKPISEQKGQHEVPNEGGQKPVLGTLVLISPAALQTDRLLQPKHTIPRTTITACICGSPKGSV